MRYLYDTDTILNNTIFNVGNDNLITIQTADDQNKHAEKLLITYFLSL